MAINLLAIKPHQVSRDLSGYITYIYGAGKTGKTTLASQMPDSLLLAFENGYNAIPGIMAQDITSWSELKQTVRELKKQEVKNVYKCVTIDTVDIAAALCEKYICSQAGVDKLTDIPYGQGWTKVKKEFEETFRTITQNGYALFFISHAKDKVFKRQDGSEYNQIVPSIANTYNEIERNMADIYGYAHQVRKEDGTTSVQLTLRSLDGSVDTGCRFKYIEPEINFSYPDLVKALNKAIDTEAKLTNNQFITDERNTVVEQSNLDFDSLMEEFRTMVNNLGENNTEERFKTYWSPRIVQITDMYLGKGKKVNQCTRDQVEMLSMIVSDLKDLIESEK